MARAGECSTLVGHRRQSGITGVSLINLAVRLLVTPGRPALAMKPAPSFSDQREDGAILVRMRL